MSWNIIASGRVNEQALELYRSGTDYMIRVGGLELMNSRWHRSEKALAQAARRWATSHAPRILIGGLGLGFTLAAFLEEFGERAEIYVAEQSIDVMRWYRDWLKDASLGALDDSRVLFLNSSVQDVLRDGGRFDLIVLDVDNGPEAICGKANAWLYEAAGLRAIKDRLRDGGTLLIWSGFESRAFEKLAGESGYSTHCLPVPVGVRDLQHFIYLFRKEKSKGLKRADFAPDI